MGLEEVCFRSVGGSGDASLLVKLPRCLSDDTNVAEMRGMLGLVSVGPHLRMEGGRAPYHYKTAFILGRQQMSRAIECCLTERT